MTSVMPHLVAELRNIWIVSNFYSTDRNMKHLMQTISRTFCKDLKAKCWLTLLLDLPSAEEAQQRVNDAMAFLQAWIDEYYEMRAVIEKSNAGSRWEFKRKDLFAHIEHYLKIFNDFDRIFQILKEFENLFGLQIKSLITKPIEIDQMLNKLDVSLKAFYKDLDFDPFARGNVEYWDAALEEFEEKVRSLENDTVQCLDRCVELLRTPAAGIDFMRRIVAMNTRERVQKHVLGMGDNVAKVLIAYIGNVEHEFMKHRLDPPIANNKSKYIGAIVWARALFEDLKANVMAFTKVFLLFFWIDLA